MKNNKDSGFSIALRIKSFTHALKGIKDLLIIEHNARIHLTATIIVIILSIILKIGLTEVILLTITTGLVWILEIINSAIEKIMDFITLEKLPQIKYIKDVSAAAVLIAAFIALITGCLIFIPKL